MPQAPAHPLCAHRIGSVALFCALFLIRGRRLTAGRRCVPWALDKYGFIRPVKNAILLLEIADRIIHRVLAGSVGTQDLTQKHRQGHRRWILALPILRQQRFQGLQQLRTSEQIEEIHRLDATCVSTDALSMLLRLKLGITITQGWPRGWSGGCFVTNILPIPASLPLIFQLLSLVSSCTRG